MANLGAILLKLNGRVEPTTSVFFVVGGHIMVRLKGALSEQVQEKRHQRTVRVQSAAFDRPGLDPKKNVSHGLAKMATPLPLNPD